MKITAAQPQHPRVDVTFNERELKELEMLIRFAPTNQVTDGAKTRHLDKIADARTVINFKKERGIR